VPLRTRDVVSALKKKGFRETDRDHKCYFFWHDGRKTAIWTKISHSDPEIHDGNCGHMARQIRLSRKEFNRFVECALTAELYLEMLISAKHL
jgi:hypothetical protein